MGQPQEICMRNAPARYIFLCVGPLARGQAIIFLEDDVLGYLRHKFIRIEYFIVLIYVQCFYV